MTRQVKAEIREIQESVHKIAYMGSGHTPDEMAALKQAMACLEAAIEETTRLTIMPSVEVLNGGEK